MESEPGGRMGVRLAKRLSRLGLLGGLLRLLLLVSAGPTLRDRVRRPAGSRARTSRSPSSCKSSSTVLWTPRSWSLARLMGTSVAAAPWDRRAVWASGHRDADTSTARTVEAY